MLAVSVHFPANAGFVNTHIAWAPGTDVGDGAGATPSVVVLTSVARASQRPGEIGVCLFMSTSFGREAGPPAPDSRSG
jgi:hypothetical protein